MAESRHEAISSIVFNTIRYPYKLNKDGTRNINRDFSKPEQFLFKFSVAELSLIIFRDSPNKLNIDNKELYFDYSNDGKLIGIHFEDEDYIWLVQNYTSIMDECKMLYVAQCTALEIMNIMVGQQQKTSNPNINIEDYLDGDDEIEDEFDIMDEFDEEEYEESD